MKPNPQRNEAQSLETISGQGPSNGDRLPDGRRYTADAVLKLAAARAGSPSGNRTTPEACESLIDRLVWFANKDGGGVATTATDETLARQRARIRYVLQYGDGADLDRDLRDKPKRGEKASPEHLQAKAVLRSSARTIRATVAALIEARVIFARTVPQRVSKGRTDRRVLFLGDPTRSGLGAELAPPAILSTGSIVLPFTADPDEAIEITPSELESGRGFQPVNSGHGCPPIGPLSAGTDARIGKRRIGKTLSEKNEEAAPCAASPAKPDDRREPKTEEAPAGGVLRAHPWAIPSTAKALGDSGHEGRKAEEGPEAKRAKPEPQAGGDLPVTDPDPKRVEVQGEIGEGAIGARVDGEKPTKKAAKKPGKPKSQRKSTLHRDLSAFKSGFEKDRGRPYEASSWPAEQKLSRDCVAPIIEAAAERIGKPPEKIIERVVAEIFDPKTRDENARWLRSLPDLGFRVFKVKLPAILGALEDAHRRKSKAASEYEAARAAQDEEDEVIRRFNLREIDADERAQRLREIRSGVSA